MLALSQRQDQHLPQLSNSPHHQPQPFNFDQLTQQLYEQKLYDQKLLHDYLDSQQQSFNPAIVIDNESNPFMTSAYEQYANPAIRVQQSTPTPQLSSSYSPSPMLSTHATASGLDTWNSYNSNAQGQTLQTPVSRSGRTHQRAASSSSVGSTGSQYQQGYPYVAHAESSPSRSAQSLDSPRNYADPPSRAFSNVASHNLPTPTATPTQDAFMNGNNFNYTPQGATVMDAHMSMKQALLDSHIPDEEAPGFGHSARHSVSSYGHDSPATPHTTQGEDMDYKMAPNGETLHKVDSWLFNEFLTYDDDADYNRHIPKLERTFTDVAADNSFDYNAVQPQPQPAANSLLSPYRTNNTNDLIQRSLQAAQIARSQSPSSSVSRGDSPFRRSSPYRQPSNTFQSPRMVGTAAAAREIKAEADAAYAMKSQAQTSDEAEPKTISPKDALLDYRDADEDSKVPLFPDGGASEYDNQYNGGDQYRNATQSAFDTTSQSYRRDSWATPQQFVSNFPTSIAATSQPTSTFAFAQPSMPSSLQGMNFAPTSNYRPAPSMPTTSDQNPEFPAHLTSMESSCSEAGPDPSSQSSVDHHLQKPANSNADHGTYTCTYHGCSQRFETPQKLQKHKREGHRNAATVSTTSATSMTSAALLERNSQAGPHKCERINPTTGKPCNTIFSRPYDLTRHEDTIHNARKQKVRCALCVEEKTFSRNDALTRHMVRTHHRNI
jgi:hypothetical protein